MMKPFLVFVSIVIILCLTGLSAEVNAKGLETGREVTVPILLYHSISSDSSTNSRYAVSMTDFKDQMEQLRYWGYSSITIKDLVDHINKGHPLPRRPIVVSFDDGYLDVFDNAFPIMERYGFTGTVYIVANRLNSDGFLQVEELQELLNHGWEVGSHGMTHTELTQNHALVRNEVLQSRLDIENALGMKVFSFAYPFGLSDWYVSSKVLDYGYRAAVGVGHLMLHSYGTVYNLSRREVQGGVDLEAFAELLPWTNHFVPSPPRRHIPD
jgi:peptidoglycan/xylan/chitin deacetylase (PgdA/CDA1 family)